jgi:hypothetical protein
MREPKSRLCGFFWRDLVKVAHLFGNPLTLFFDVPRWPKIILKI